LHKNNIISKEQYGFQRGFTMENTVYKLISEVLNALNNKQIVGGIFCDLSKAFDCVDHDILISKMEKYGIIVKGKELIQSYIKGRYQRVLIGSKTNHNITVSYWALIKHGVPQGSVLGPTLLLLYINDLPVVINKKAIPVLFADDTSVLCTHHNFMEFQVNIDTVLGNVYKWFKKLPLIKHLKKLTTYILRQRTFHPLT
jgi:hypothetical protein